MGWVARVGGPPDVDAVAPIVAEELRAHFGHARLVPLAPMDVEPARVTA
jgi:hypothetical protein